MAVFLGKEPSGPPIYLTNRLMKTVHAEHPASRQSLPTTCRCIHTDSHAGDRSHLLMGIPQTHTGRHSLLAHHHHCHSRPLSGLTVTGDSSALRYDIWLRHCAGKLLTELYANPPPSRSQQPHQPSPTAKTKLARLSRQALTSWPNQSSEFLPLRRASA